MSETVTTERARNLLDSDYVKHIPDIHALIAEALAGRDRIAELTASLAAAQSELAAIKGKVEYRLLPDHITRAYGLSFELTPISVPALAADGLLANPPLGYQIERRVNYQSPWTPAEEGRP